MTRPRSTEDIEELRLRASLRLERRGRTYRSALATSGIASPADRAGVLGYRSGLVREAAALVAALDDVLVEREDGLRAAADENMRRWAHGDR